MTDLLGRAHSEAGSRGKLYSDTCPDVPLTGLSVPGVSNMSMMSMTMLKSLIQSVAAVVVDIVPPLIPPPIWIMRWALLVAWQDRRNRRRLFRPLPCLPMLTGTAPRLLSRQHGRHIVARRSELPRVRVVSDHHVRVHDGGRERLRNERGYRQVTL